MAKFDRKAFLKTLSDQADAFRRRIEAECDGFDPDPLASAERKTKAANDFRYFCRTYFPHYIRHGESAVHAFVFEQVPRVIGARVSCNLAVAAPRGEGKSVYFSLLLPLWCALFERKHYAIIGMDVFDQAALMLEGIKAELEFNPRLQLDFPDRTGQGRTWQMGVIVTRNNRKIEAVGSGKKIRGRRHGPYRPDLFVGDDLENDENVKTPEQRDKLQSWLHKAVMQLGGPGEKYDVIVIGTVLHYDSVLARLLSNPLWESKRFRSIVRWPERMDLWDRWEALYKSDGEAVARAFWDAHMGPMERGAVVSWPQGRPLYDLMVIRARDGHPAFDSEHQNDPLSGEDAPFQGCLNYWVDWVAEWIFFGSCDPSLGRKGNSRDPSAILVGGFDKRNGVLDVVEASIRKRVPDRIISDIIEYQRRYRCLLWYVESVAFQEFLRTELVKRSAKAGIPVPAHATPDQTTDKLLRIESLQPHMANGLIRVHRDQSELISQLLHFPKADHEDGPDALEMLWRAATSGFGAIEYTSAAKATLGSLWGKFARGF